MVRQQLEMQNRHVQKYLVSGCQGGEARPIMRSWAARGLNEASVRVPMILTIGIATVPATMAPAPPPK